MDAFNHKCQHHELRQVDQAIGSLNATRHNVPKESSVRAPSWDGARAVNLPNSVFNGSFDDFDRGIGREAGSACVSLSQVFRKDGIWRDDRGECRKRASG